MTANIASEETEVTITEFGSRYHLERTLEKLLQTTSAAVPRWRRYWRRRRFRCECQSTILSRRKS